MNNIKLALAEILLETKIARRIFAQQFILNDDMHFEANLLQAEIETLKTIIVREKNNIE